MSKRKITGKLLVIQLGREETQIALMGSGSGVAYSSIVETPAGAVEDGMIRNVEAVRGMLKNALSVPEFKKVRKAIFTLSTSQVISETITTPNMSGKKLAKVIQANIDEYFPVDTRDYQLVWQPIGPTEDNMLSVQLWAVPHAMLARYYGVANDCGLSLEAVDYCGNAIATAVGATFARPVKETAKARKKLSLNMELSFGRKKEAEIETAPTFASQGSQDTDLYISLEKDLLGMTFVQEGQVVMQRFVQCGGDPTYQLAELAMMVEYFRASEHGRGATIRGAALGTLAEDHELLRELADMLAIPLSLVDAGCDPRWVMSLGAAACTLDFGVPTLNKPGKARHEVRSQLWQYILLLGSGLVVVLMFMFLLNSRLTWSTQLGVLEATRQALTIQSAKTAGYADNYKNYAAKYDAYSADWDAIFGSLRTYNDNLVLVLQELETILPEKASVTGLQIAETGLAVQFACEDKEVAAYLIMELRDNMQYADLMSITSLQGGGSGPATEFGNQEEGEAAPTEGSFQLTDAMKNQLVNMVADSLDTDTIMDVALSLTPEQVELVETVYGNQPQTTYSRLVAIKTDKGAEEVTMLRRANAVHDLLTTNYFAMYHFFNLLGEDIYRDEPYMWKSIQADMMLPENQDIWNAIITGSVSDAQTMRKYADRVVAMLVKDEQTITATENLLCTTSKMERWYIYYLEQQLGMREKENFPYMNIDQVIYDLMEGGFNTGDSMLDVKLNSLIPESAWDMLELIQKDDSDPDSLLGGLTEQDVIKILQTYINKGGDTGNAAQNALVNKVIQKYINDETTGYKNLDQVLYNYLKNGGSSDSTEPKEEFIIGNYTEPQLKYLMDLYRKNGTTGNQEQDQLIYSILYVYNRDKTTGIPALDKFLEEYFEGDDLASLLLALQGNSGAGSGGSVDTRIHFTAALAYNDELKNAELNRKGLDYEDKIDKLTVEVGD